MRVRGTSLLWINMVEFDENSFNLFKLLELTFHRFRNPSWTKSTLNNNTELIFNRVDEHLLVVLAWVGETF